MKTKTLTNNGKPTTVHSLNEELSDRFMEKMDSPQGQKLMALADKLRQQGIALDKVAQPPWVIYGEDAEQWLTKFTEDANQIGEFFNKTRKGEDLKVHEGITNRLQGLFALVAWLTIKKDAMKVMGLSQHVRLKAIQADSNSRHALVEEQRRQRLEQGEE